MKKNTSGLILLAEIAAIVTFHAVKIRSEKQIMSKEPVSSSISLSSLLPEKPAYIFVNMLK